jgi:ankyrin repeat protein
MRQFHGHSWRGRSTSKRKSENDLLEAARKGLKTVTRLLLEKGAKAEPKDKNGMTALYKACANGHEEVAQLLLENRARVDTKE